MIVGSRCLQELVSLFDKCWVSWMTPGPVIAAKDNGSGVEDLDVLLQIAESHALFGRSWARLGGLPCLATAFLSHSKISSVLG